MVIKTVNGGMTVQACQANSAVRSSVKCARKEDRSAKSIFRPVEGTTVLGHFRLKTARVAICKPNARHAGRSFDKDDSNSIYRMGQPERRVFRRRMA